MIPPDQLRRTDMIMEFQLSPMNPAACLIAVAPTDGIALLTNQRAVQQANGFVIYQKLKDLPDLCFQFNFSDSPQGKHPPGTIVSMAMMNEE